MRSMTSLPVSLVPVRRFDVRDKNIFVCMVAICIHNDLEGGCISESEHTLIELKDGMAICSCFEVTKEIQPLRLVVDNKK